MAAGSRAAAGRTDWKSWPVYDAAATGLREYWYPVAWSTQVSRAPVAVRVCGEDIVLQRDEQGGVRAARPLPAPRRSAVDWASSSSRHVHLPVPRLDLQAPDGELVAVITDGPDSPICGKVRCRRTRSTRRLGLVWVYVGDGQPHPLDEQLPEELVDAPPPGSAGGSRIATATGGFRRERLRRGPRQVPPPHASVAAVQADADVEQDAHRAPRAVDLPRPGRAALGRRLPRPGHWTNQRWWKIKPRRAAGQAARQHGRRRQLDPVHRGPGLPGFASLRLPGVLRIAYPHFIHYEFYVPIDAERTRYVGVMVNFGPGPRALPSSPSTSGGIRWLFHGNSPARTTGWSPSTDAPPERLYRPDVSLLEWRRLVEEGHPFDGRHMTADGGP